MHFNDSLMPLCSHNFNSILQVPILKGGLFLLIKAVVCLKISPAGTLWSLFYELVSRLALGLSFDMPEVEQLKIPIINLKEVTFKHQSKCNFCHYGVLKNTILGGLLIELNIFLTNFLCNQTI